MKGLGERDSNNAQGVIIQTGSIGVGGPHIGMWADLDVKYQDNTYNRSGRFSAGHTFTIPRNGQSPIKVVVKDISMSIDDPSITLEQLQKLGIIAEALVSREVVLIVSGEKLVSAN